MRATSGWRHLPRLVVFLLLVAAAIVPVGPAVPAPAAPLAACGPRPPVGVNVAPGAAGALQVTITANTNPNTPSNQLSSLSFGAATGALIDVPGLPPGQTGNFSVQLATSQTSFTVRQAVPGQAATVPLTVTDTCGAWPTLVGGGPNAFPTATPGGAVPTATATPTKPPSLAVGLTTIGVSTPEPVVWGNIPAPTNLDWIGMFVPGSLDTSYVGGPRFTGSTLPSGSTDFGIPADVPAGTYEMRLYSNKSTARLAQSGLFTVTRPAPTAVVGAGPPPNFVGPVARVDAAGDVGRHASLTLSNNNPNLVEDDLPAISYYDATQGKLKVATCGDPGCGSVTSVWTPDVTTANNGQFTSIQYDSNGFPVVSYYDVTLGKLKVLRCGVVLCNTAINCSNPNFNCIATPDPSANAGQFTSLQVDSGNRPIVSYYDVGNQRLKVLRCGNPTCTSGNLIAAPDLSSANNGQYTSLQLDASARPVVSYYDVTNQALKLLHCGDAACVNGNSVVTVDAIGNVGQFTSLALDTLGNPVISYYDATNQRLKLAHCSDPNCANPAVISSPDPATGVGQYSSLRMDVLGRPVVAYYDATFGRLKVLHCSNSSCSAASTHTVNVADNGNVGQYAALMLDKDPSSGRNLINPVVAYFDAANQDLKLVHCSSPTCAAAPADDGDVGRYSALRLSGGIPTVSYYDTDATTLTVLRCGNADCSAPQDFNAPNPCPANTSCFTQPDGVHADSGRGSALVIDGSGRPVVSYLSAANSSSNGGLSILRCGDAACRSGNNINTISAGGTVGPSTSIALDGASNPVVSFWDAGAGKLKVLHCVNTTCTGAVANGSPGTPCPGGSNCLATPDAAANVGQYNSLQLDASGRPVVSYYDIAAGKLKVLHCGDANCTSAANVIATPDTTSSNNGQYTSLQLDASKFPVVSYYDAALGRLKVLHCGDANCTVAGSLTIASVDSAANVGLFTSLAMDPLDRPVVSYYDFTNGDLKIAKCANATCTNGGVIFAADTLSNRPPSPPLPPAGLDNVGQFTSLALDASGFPIVSYYDATNGDLRVLRCRTTTCR